MRYVPWCSSVLSTDSRVAVVVCGEYVALLSVTDVFFFLGGEGFYHIKGSDTKCQQRVHNKMYVCLCVLLQSYIVSLHNLCTLVYNVNISNVWMTLMN